MGKIVIEDIDMISISGPHVATSWRVETFNEDSQGELLFESLNDRENLLSIITTLKYPDGRYYPPEYGSRPYAKFHFYNKITNKIEETEWYALVPCGIHFLPQSLPYMTK